MKENANTSSRARDPFSGLDLFSEDAFRSLGSMEAVEWSPPISKPHPFRDRLPGFLTATLLAISSYFLVRSLSQQVPLGMSALALLLGILVGNSGLGLSALREGCRWIVATMIPVAIVLIGTGLDLGILFAEGWRFLGYLLFTVLFSTLITLWIGKRLGINPQTSLLIGAGTGICGSSAILAIAPLVKAKDEDVLLSVGAINLVGLVAMLACLGVAKWVPISPMDYGILAGATIHAVPTVTAAAFEQGPEAGQIATLVKMGRVAMLVPLVLAISLLGKRQSPRTLNAKNSTAWERFTGIVPWFVWGFVLAAGAGTLGLIPDLQWPKSPFGSHETVSGSALCQQAGKGMLTLAMAAIGLQVHLRSMIAVGARAVLCAGLTWILLVTAVLATLLLS